MLMHLFTLSSLIISVVLAQLESPCPQVLQYEPRNEDEIDRWYGVVTLSTPEDLDGLWLKIILDAKADLLGNWFADAESSDDIEYSIEDLSYTFEAGSSLSIRFFIHYNPDNIVPTVKRILLNGQWPWHVALYSFNDTDGTVLIYTCGGTIISEQFVVTAAHCVTGSTGPVDKASLVIYSGTKYYHVYHTNRGRRDIEVQVRLIKEIYVHSFYLIYKYNKYSIAILKLALPLVFNNFVRPCCLWEDETSNMDDLVGQQGTVGWCDSENNQLVPAQLPIVTDITCRRSNPMLFNQLKLDKNFCAELKNGTPACPEALGGGMVMVRNGLWQLRGIIAAGVPQEGQKVQNLYKYVVFVDVPIYIQWIKNITLQYKDT